MLNKLNRLSPDAITENKGDLVEFLSPLKEILLNSPIELDKDP